MSDSAETKAEAQDRQALTRLEAAVGRLLDESTRLRGRARSAEARVRDLEALLRRFTQGDADPATLQARLAELEAENEDLKERIRQGREGVERLVSRIRFLEDQR